MSLHVGYVSHPHLPDHISEHDEEEHECKDRRGPELPIEQPTEQRKDAGRNNQLDGACERVTETGIEVALFLKIQSVNRSRGDHRRRL